MSKMTDSKIVQEQYESSKNLDIRISIHNKYSTNKLGFGNWIYEHYNFYNGCKILELGCGNAKMWRDRIDLIGDLSELILSDISEGMLDCVRAEFIDNKKIAIQNINIESIPYEDETFDYLIANMVLYHVPDLSKGLKEIKRVLKKNGVLYCATFGINGIHQYLTKVLYGSDHIDLMEGFIRQNGHMILSQYFNQVKEYVYEDSLEVRDTNDLVDYFFSTIDFDMNQELDRDFVYNKFEGLKENGFIKVPKDYGMFECVNI